MRDAENSVSITESSRVREAICRSLERRTSGRGWNWDCDVDVEAEVITSGSENGDGVFMFVFVFVSTPLTPMATPPAMLPFPDFVDALSGLTCCAAWSVFERPWRAARGGVAMGDLFVRRLEEVVARVAFLSWVLMVMEALKASYFITLSEGGRIGGVVRVRDVFVWVEVYWWLPCGLERAELSLRG